MTTGDGCLGYNAGGDSEEAGSVCCSDGSSFIQCQDGTTVFANCLDSTPVCHDGEQLVGCNSS